MKQEINKLEVMKKVEETVDDLLVQYDLALANGLNSVAEGIGNQISEALDRLNGNVYNVKTEVLNQQQ